MATVIWSQDQADIYDATSAAMYAPEVLGPTVDFLADLAGSGPALELAVGTGRVALALSARGIGVRGIDLSPAMVEQMRGKAGADAVDVTVGDMTTTRLDGSFTLVYVVWNAITTVTTQAEQMAVFANAAAHLEPGGHFVVEVVVPQWGRLPRGELGRVFTLEPGHVGIETFEDTASQISWSHHWIEVEGRLHYHRQPHRYVWPAELDLMARLAHFDRRDRFAGWSRAPFTADSVNQVVVYRKGTE
jgi:SAM-dependent methyltransferase